MTIDPIKVCCGQRQSLHIGPVCPDGTVMCELCFEKFFLSDLWVDEDGIRVNICMPCGKRENSYGE